MNNPPAETDLDLVVYSAEQKRMVAAFKQLPRGSQASASYDLRVSQSLISGVLSLRMIDAELLARLKTWVKEQFGIDVDTIQLPAPE